MDPRQLKSEAEAELWESAYSAFRRNGCQPAFYHRRQAVHFRQPA
jgi:hypothetical protein